MNGPSWDRLTLNVPLPTLGGAQLWADEAFWHGWHIQRNAITGHYRLLDASGVRRAWGSLRHCRERLRSIAGRADSKPMSGAAVIVMHGLLRSARGMRGLARYLQREGGYTAINVNYPSTRLPIADHAASLDRILQSLEGIDEIHLVCHSLGNLVVRHYLADSARGAHAGPSGPDPRLRRMVMLGPPNQGASIAGWLAKFDPLRLLGAAHEIREWGALEPRLATPAFELGVIAGGRGARRGYNPLLGGDNDLIVTVESTRLAGARDFACVPVLHTLMMDDRRVREMTLNFLRHGYFLSADNRQAITDAG